MGVEIAAQAAAADFLGRRGERRGERQQQRFAFLDEMEHGTARRARAETGQAGQQLDQTVDLGNGHRAQEVPQNGSCMPGGS